MSVKPAGDGLNQERLYRGIDVLVDSNSNDRAILRFW